MTYLNTKCNFVFRRCEKDITLLLAKILFFLVLIFNFTDSLELRNCIKESTPSRNQSFTEIVEIAPNALLLFILVSYAGDRPPWPIQSPKMGWKKKSKRLRGEGDNIEFIDLRFEIWHVVGFGKGRRHMKKHATGFA